MYWKVVKTSKVVISLEKNVNLLNWWYHFILKECCSTTVQFDMFCNVLQFLNIFYNNFIYSAKFFRVDVSLRCYRQSCSIKHKAHLDLENSVNVQRLKNCKTQWAPILRIKLLLNFKSRSPALTCHNQRPHILYWLVLLHSNITYLQLRRIETLEEKFGSFV